MYTLSLFEKYYQHGVYPFDNSICNSLTKSKINCNSINNVMFSPLGPKGKIGIPYKYKNCKKNSETSILKSSPSKKIYLNKLKFNNICKTLELCKLKNNLAYCGLDEFTNESFIGLAIEDVVRKHKIKTKSFVKQYNAYICNEVSYNHMELCDLGDMSKVINTKDLTQKHKKFCQNKSAVLSHCLLQITKILPFLQVRCQYTHGDLKAGNVFIKNETTVTKLGTEKILSPITFKLADYGKNCITLGKYRLFNDHKVRPYIPRIRLNSDNKTFVLSKFTYVPRYYRSQILFAYLRHIGLPFNGDIDIYILIASLLLHKDYGDVLLAFPKSFHKILWEDLQVSMLTQHIKNIKTTVPSDKLSSVTTAMYFLTKKLPNGKYLILKKNVSKKLFKNLFHLIKNKKI